MKVTVRMFGRFKDQFGDRKEVSVTEGITPVAALADVLKASPDGYTAIFDDRDQIRPHIILMVNRKRIAHAECATISLHDGDELAVLPPVAGG